MPFGEHQAGRGNSRMLDRPDWPHRAAFGIILLGSQLGGSRSNVIQEFSSLGKAGQIHAQSSGECTAHSFPQPYSIVG